MTIEELQKMTEGEAFMRLEALERECRELRRLLSEVLKVSDVYRMLPVNLQAKIREALK